MLNRLILKIKRKENIFYEALYKAGKGLINFNIPTIKFIHLPLYYLNHYLKIIATHLIQKLWSIPLFKARCNIVGKNLKLPNGIPLINGEHLIINLGNNVTIGRSTIGANKIFDNPVLNVGNNTTIGYGTLISVAKEVNIGSNCMIATNCIIMDSDDHPINPNKRMKGEEIGKEDIKTVNIGDNVWVGSYCAILKGVTIGDNSIISAHSVVTRDVMANCIYAGNPARPTLREINKY